jgi:hypothetical protein
MPHLVKMNLFAKLLLEMSTDRFFPFSYSRESTESKSADFRQSGIEANTDGVALGSCEICLPFTSEVKVNQTLALVSP